MKPINIFLDDERDPQFVKNKLGDNFPQDWKVIRNYFDFVNFVDQNFDNIKLVSFDHDIQSFDQSGKEFTGKDAADYMITKCLDTGRDFPDFYVHSMNNTGKQNILGIILNYLRKVEGKKIDFMYYNSGIVNNQIL